MYKYHALLLLRVLAMPSNVAAATSFLIRTKGSALFNVDIEVEKI